MKQGVLEVSTTQIYPLGKRLAFGDRIYRYAHADAEGLLRAAYAVTPKIHYVQRGVPAVLAPAGTNTINLTAVTADVVTNQFAGGIASQAGSGYGTNYKIISNTGATVGNVYTITLAEKIIVDIPVTDNITLFENMWANVFCIRQRSLLGVTNYDRQLSAFIGVPNRPIPADNYCWLQTRGPCMIIPSSGTEGVAWDDRAMSFQWDGCVAHVLYDVPERQQYAGYVLPLTSDGTSIPTVGVAIPDLLLIFLQLE